MHEIIYPDKHNSFEILRAKTSSKNAYIITDSNLEKIYNKELSCYKYFVIPAGEDSKSFSIIESISLQLLEVGADRNSTLIGFGGGVVTDFTGFLASIYMRGIKFAYVSTSVIGQVDACIGGKTGINNSLAKNILGTFNEPEFSIIATDLLQTLPKIEFTNGFAEIIKHGLIADFNYLENLNNNNLEMVEIIRKSNEIKSTFVKNDFKESGIRKILNFGHTFGHAIEKISTLRHGFAIAIGMSLSAKISHKLEFLSSDELNSIFQIIEKFNLPTTSDLNFADVFDIIRFDKKRNSDYIDFILLETLGKAKIERFSFDKLERIAKDLW